MNIIFIVEDNCADIRLILESLKDMSQAIKIKFFYDGESAIKFLSEITNFESAPIGIILDINMHKINGFEVLEYIRKNKIIANIPVVMLTTSSEMVDKEKAKSLKAGYYVKPFNFKDLEKILTSILSVFKVT